MCSKKSRHMTNGEAEVTEPAGRRVVTGSSCEAALPLFTLRPDAPAVSSLIPIHLSRQDDTSLSHPSSETISRPRYQSNLPQRRRGRCRTRRFLRWHQPIQRGWDWRFSLWTRSTEFREDRLLYGTEWFTKYNSPTGRVGSHVRRGTTTSQ
jgi:hypothetical protein